MYEPNVKSHEIIGAMLNEISIEKDYERDFDKQFVYTHHDTGIKNSLSDARLKLYKNGDIELLSTDEAGVYVSSNHRSVSLNGMFGHLHFDKLLFTTKEDGLMWNGYVLNPMLRTLCDDYHDIKLICKDKENNTIEISPFIKKEKIKNDDINHLLKNRSQFINTDMDDDALVEHIIGISELQEPIEDEFYEDYYEENKECVGDD